MSFIWISTIRIVRLMILSVWERWSGLHSAHNCNISDRMTSSIRII